MRIIINYISVLACLLVMQTTGLSQVSEKVHYMSEGNNNAYYFDIETNDDKGIEKLFKSFFKEYGKMKYNRKNKEFASKTAVPIPSNSSIAYNVFFKLEKNNNVLVGYVWAKNGDEFISSESGGEDAKKIKAMVEEFAHKSEIYIVEEILNDEEDALKKLEKNLVKLEKRNTKYHKNIENAKNDIIGWEQDIENNINEQEKTNGEIDSQRGRVQKVKDNLNSLK